MLYRKYLPTTIFIPWQVSTGRNSAHDPVGASYRFFHPVNGANLQAVYERVRTEKAFATLKVVELGVDDLRNFTLGFTVTSNSVLISLTILLI